MTDTTEPGFGYIITPAAELEGGQIHRAILAVVKEIPPVDKNGELELGGRKVPFTKIDEVRDALNPILAKHGIVSYPELIEKRTERQVAQEPMTMAQSFKVPVVDEAGNRVLGRDDKPIERTVIDASGREIRDGKIPTTRCWAEVVYGLRFVFVGDNSEVTPTAAGEAYDTNSDKATGKATTAAIKRILMETFKITDRKEIDPDSVGEDEGNRAATTDRRAPDGQDRGGQARAAAQAGQATGSTRRSGPAKQAPAATPAEPAQPSDEAVASADPATGEVQDAPEPTKLDAEKGRVREAVKALQARDGEGSWQPAQVDALAAEVTGKSPRSSWINLVTAVKKVADALELKLKGE